MTPETLRRYVSEMPWPSGKRPVVKYGFTPEHGHSVLLHETCKDGWKDVSSVSAPSPETALALALELWLERKGLADRPVLYDAIRRLSS